MSVRISLKLHAYYDNPRSVLSRQEPAIPESIQNKLVAPSSNTLRLLAKPDADDVATSFVYQVLQSPSFGTSFHEVLYKYGQLENGDDEVNQWIQQQGYATTLEDVTAAFDQVLQESLLAWTGQYQTNFDNATVIVVGDETSWKSQIYYNGIYIKKFTYQNSVLSWSTADGNPVSAQLTFG